MPWDTILGITCFDLCEAQLSTWSAAYDPAMAFRQKEGSHTHTHTHTHTRAGVKNEVPHVACAVVDVGQGVGLQARQPNLAQLGIHAAVQEDVAQAHIAVQHRLQQSHLMLAGPTGKSGENLAHKYLMQLSTPVVCHAPRGHQEFDSD